MTNQTFVIDISHMPEGDDDPRLALVEEIHHALTATTSRVTVYVKGTEGLEENTHAVANFLLATVAGVCFKRLILFKHGLIELNLVESLCLRVAIDFLGKERLAVRGAEPWMSE